MRPLSRERFDALFEKVLGELPTYIRQALEEVPVILEDEPSREILIEMGIDPNEADDSDLCGLHSGVPLDERAPSQSAIEPENIYLFRGPIWRLTNGRARELEHEIRITLLHELGHHFGFEEEELEALGYE